MLTPTTTCGGDDGMRGENVARAPGIPWEPCGPGAQQQQLEIRWGGSHAEAVQVSTSGCTAAAIDDRRV